MGCMLETERFGGNCMDLSEFSWTQEPKSYDIDSNQLTVVTNPHTDMWQNTYYHFVNKNAPIFKTMTDWQFFSFTVKTDFDSKHRFDQCGVVVYLDDENWIKGSIEYENNELQHLGSVVTNNGFSDWATTNVDPSLKSMWYRISRREDDFRVENSTDGKHFEQMRICHLMNTTKSVAFGIYACSPEESSFTSHFELSDCKWLAHDGQQPD